MLIIFKKKKTVNHFPTFLDNFTYSLINAILIIILLEAPSSQKIE